MQEQIGFEWQSYLSGACGKYSLRHSLLLLGIPLTRKDANKATGLPSVITMGFGTNEERLKKGIRYFDCIPIVYETKDKSKFRNKLNQLLKLGYPVIVSFQNDNHWAVICGIKNNNEYYYIDSASEELVSYYSWSDMVDDIDNDTYYLVGVKPRNPAQLKYSLVPDFHKVEKILNRGDELFAWWGYYLEDLNEIFDCPVKKNNVITASVFFKRYGKTVYESGKFFYYYFDEKKMFWEYNNYRVVAEAYNLTLSKEKLDQGIAKFSSALTCVTCLYD